MESHLLLKLRVKAKPRQSLHLPNKILSLKTSQYERLSHVAGGTCNHFRSNSQKQSPTKRLKLFSIAISRRFDPDHTITISSDDLFQSKNNFRKILKRFTPTNQDKKGKGNLIVQRMLIDKKLSNRSKTENEDHVVQKLKKSVFLNSEINDDFRSEIEKKFSVTRSLFKEQGKVKNIDRLNKIYQRKNSFLRKQGQQGINKLKDEQKERFSPWHKYRSQRNGMFEIEQNGYTDELF